MKKLKILTILVLCMVFISPVSTQSIYASNNINTPITIAPAYANISYTTTALANSGGQASCSSTISAYSNTNLKIFMYLEKYVGGTWTPYASWSDSKSGISLTLSKKVSVSSGTYRIKSSYYAGTENTVKYSATKTF